VAVRVKTSWRRSEAQIRLQVTGPKGYAGKLVKDTVRVTTNYAKVHAPVDTGRLRSSIGGRITTRLDAVHGEVSTNVKYALLVHNGTKPHEIRPKAAKALRFKVGSRIVYARRVHHPGTKARPFLTDALRQAAGSSGVRFGLDIG
jgi:hypothetical protein